MNTPKNGARYTYAGGEGLGHMHAENGLSADMHELDLADGTQVEVAAWDDERSLVVIEWADRQGNTRMTSVEPSVFAEHFKKG
jgi:hypothetical protein